MKIPLIIAAFYGLTSVILGAFGAHALKDRFTDGQLVSWETGVRYQMFHAIAMILMVLLADKGFNVKPSVWAFCLGTLLFSGSIYLLCLGLGPKAVWGPVTPLGGLALIIGWGWLLVEAVRSQ
ncbi:DUF423 domain-containing protein [Kiritimatiellaeota bacterium B1221]|nr:DUF423 domain-containing protein [Kiritimatiellaeota bacterium B1221]